MPDKQPQSMTKEEFIEHIVRLLNLRIASIDDPLKLEFMYHAFGLFSQMYDDMLKGGIEYGKKQVINGKSGDPLMINMSEPMDYYSQYLVQFMQVAFTRGIADGAAEQLGPGHNIAMTMKSATDEQAEQYGDIAEPGIPHFDLTHKPLNNN